MRKYLALRNAAGVVFALGAVAMLGGYWHVQQQKVNDLQQQINQLPDGKDKVSLVKDRIALENTIVGSLIQTVGGLLLFVTAYVSLQSLKATQQNVSIAQRNLLVSEEKQVTERFTQAINQLGSDKIEVRFGGIYALERIAKDSPKDHWTIMEVLTSFVQEKSSLPHSGQSEEQVLTNIRKDVQAALTVIGRRESGHDSERGHLDLRRALLIGVDLSGGLLNDADLTGANLIGANLTGANLTGANLRWAFLSKANLTGADLTSANLPSANLAESDLRGASLIQAFLSKANLTGADLTGADLTGANLTGADLTGADLAGAYLENSKELTPEQVKAAKSWEKAHYGEDFRRQLGLSPKSEQQS